MRLARYAAALATLGTLAAGAAHAQSRPAPALEGIYHGLRESTALGGIYPDWYTFFPDGRVLRGIPRDGMGAPVDWAGECANSECGTFRRVGSQVRASINGHPEEVLFNVDARGVLRKPGKTQGYRRMHLPDGTRMSAAYGQEGLYSLRLSPDGRFREQGLLRYTAWADHGDSAARRRVAVPSGSGTYTLRRGTLELRYDGGPTVTLSIAVPPGVPPGPSPRSIYLMYADLDALP